ncbi:MAG: SUMF1/EgtB/PvdO family nonheme iron enzyme [Myxococcota bacterium]
MFTHFDSAWSLSDRIFDLVDRSAWTKKGIVLRHPILFYVGHLPAFAYNQWRAAHGAEPFEPRFDTLFARGIDPEDEVEAAGLAPETWPDISAILEYRDNIRTFLREHVQGDDAAAQTMQGLILEHELMHHETLLYLVAQMEPAVLTAPERWAEVTLGSGRDAEPIEVASGSVRLGVEHGDIPFGWDNEFPSQTVDVPAFTIDDVPVTIERFAAFVEDGGYDRSDLWDAADLRWLRRTGRTHPQFWRRSGAGWQVRSLFAWHEREDVAGWPVHVSYAEALAYARWIGRRLPTEGELHRATFTTPDGEERPFAWGNEAVGPEHGSIAYQRHARVPVGQTPDAVSAWGVHDLVGNSWEWTSTPFLPRPGFEPIHPTYPGYSADFFDGRHQVVFGASWATDPRFVRRSFRNWYGRRYPYVFATFRTVA